MEALHATHKAIIQENVIKNLLSAHQRIAESGDTVALIRLSKYLLYLAKKYGDVVVNVSAKCNE